MKTEAAPVTSPPHHGILPVRVRPLRLAYWHYDCRKVTSLDSSIARVFARDPRAYRRTWCAHCRRFDWIAAFFWCKPGDIDTRPTQWQVGK